MERKVSFEEAKDGLNKIRLSLESKTCLSDADIERLIDINLAEKSMIRGEVVSLYLGLLMRESYEKKSNLYRFNEEKVDIEYEEIPPRKESTSFELIPLDKVLINPRTQKEYDTLMQVYERAGWRWGLDNLKPTDSDVWRIYKRKTCIDAGYSPFEGGGFFLSTDLDRAEKSSTILSPWDFYSHQKLNLFEIDDLNDWFNESNPKRASRGTFWNRFWHRNPKR
ncbi:MAG: hypothetical protein Q8Q04_00890 [archaeon]|nr:hypothetical protein [archaeon]